jgi:Uncharacterized protein conserved in archaea
MPDYLVVLESAWTIRDANSVDDAISIAISEAGKRLNPKAKFVEVEAGYLSCPYCEEELPCTLVVAKTALVGIKMEMKVYKADPRNTQEESHSRLSEKHSVTSLWRSSRLKNCDFSSRPYCC